MAAVVAVITGVEIIRGLTNASSGSNQSNMRTAIIYGHNGDTAVAGGTDTLDFDLDAILEAYLKQGGSATIRIAGNCAIIQSARNTSGTAFGATATLSSETLSLTPKTPADWSTNATIAASAVGSGTGAANGSVTGGLGAGARPFGIVVGFEYA